MRSYVALRRFAAFLPAAIEVMMEASRRRAPPTDEENVRCMNIISSNVILVEKDDIVIVTSDGSVEDGSWMPSLVNGSFCFVPCFKTRPFLAPLEETSP